MNRTVLIPAAGLGSRLGEFSKNYSKAMLTLGTRPAFSYIFDLFDKDDEFIVLLGYKGELLKECIEAYYPNYNITFVNVDKFEGPGSGLGYSILQAKDLLQKPFFFHSCDTLYTDGDGIALMQGTIRRMDLSRNYVFCADAENDGAEYRFVDFEKNCEHSSVDGFRNLWSFSTRAVRILPKDIKKDKNTSAPYIGVAYIRDYEKFWEVADRPEFIEVGESLGINNLDSIYAIKLVGNVWIDSGNKAIYTKYRDLYQRQSDVAILPKPDEGIWILDDRVIKFHCDKSFIYNRVRKANFLRMGFRNKNLLEKVDIPNILTHSDHVYVYKKEDGEVMSKIVNPALFKQLLDVTTKNVDPIRRDEIALERDPDTFNKTFYKLFYEKKTKDRVERFLKTNEMIERDITINGLKCEPALSLLKKVDFNSYSKDAVMTYGAHGDFHLENVLYNKQKDKFILLDWRQGFLNDGANSDYIGDLYYDFGKMFHSFIVNHQMIKLGLYSIDETNSGVNIDIHNTFMDNECCKVLEKFIIDNGYNLRLAKLITAVIFLNICAMHESPYCVFLYYLGRYLLQQWINDSNVKE